MFQSHKGQIAELDGSLPGAAAEKKTEGIRVWEGFRVQDLGLGFRVQQSGFIEFRVWGLSLSFKYVLLGSDASGLEGLGGEGIV